MKQSIILCICCIALALSGFSKTIEWSVFPEYDELKPYSENVYYCSIGGKWGLVTSTGKVLLTPQYDFVTTMIDGYALAGMKDGNKNRICCIIDEECGIVNLTETYYLVNKYYTYFSENKMPVANKQGKQGFINTSGNIVVKCQFENVHPFSSGFASVSNYPHAYYITEYYDKNPGQNILPVDFNYGDISFASTFYQGQAVVAFNNKSAIINTSGKKVGNYKGKIDQSCYNRFDYTIKGCGSVPKAQADYDPAVNTEIIPFLETGAYGYKQDDNIIAYPTFTTAGPVLTTGYAVVGMNGKQGILQFVDGDIKSFLAKADETQPFSGSFKASESGTIDKCEYILTLPPTSNPIDYSVYVCNGKGTEQLSATKFVNGLLKAELTPTPAAKKAKNVAITAEVRYKGIPIHKYAGTFDITYPVVAPPPTPVQTEVHHATSLSITGPILQTATANEHDFQIVSAVISNHTGSAATVTATISIPSKRSTSQKLTIPNGGSQTISLAVKVLKKESVTATVTLSSGEQASKTVTLLPYY